MVRFNSKRAFHTCIQIMEVLKLGHSKKKKHYGFKLPRSSLVGKRERYFVLPSFLSWNAADSKKSAKSWALAPKCKKNTVLSPKKSVCNSFSSTDCHTISAPQRWEPWKRKSYRDTSIKLIQRNIFFQILANVLFL